MNPDHLKHHFINAMVKHLPPSASTLRLVDIEGRTEDILSSRRRDIDIVVLTSDAIGESTLDDDSVDAIVAYNIALNTSLLIRCLKLMRAGGRFIAVSSQGDVSEDHVKMLKNHGFVRILVESAVDDLGVLIRGEKAHTTDNTLKRIQQVAVADTDMLDLASFKGRYVHLLIRQTPNKPVWKLTADEQIQWQAVAVQQEDTLSVLGFSSLPKAVGFMQPAVVDGIVRDINKVGKFRKTTATDWTWRVLLNPTLESIRDKSLQLIDIDPTTAEASDE